VTSESERDFYRERATIRASESKRAKFKTALDFFTRLRIFLWNLAISRARFTYERARKRLVSRLRVYWEALYMFSYVVGTDMLLVSVVRYICVVAAGVHAGSNDWHYAQLLPALCARHTVTCVSLITNL